MGMILNGKRIITGCETEMELKEIELGLAPHEHITDYKCPQCGGTIIRNCGPGIIIDFCLNPKCDYEDTDYEF